MTAKRGSGTAKLRICAFCGFPMARERPVFLVAMPDNRIVGPLHAGCAERSVIASEEIRARGLEPAIEFGRIIHAAREETLPW